MKKVLFAASEAVPFIKLGGLADVVGTLPKNFDKSLYDVRVIIPKYSAIPEEYNQKMEFVGDFNMKLASKRRYGGVYSLEHDGITFYFVDNEFFFAGEKPYGEMSDDIEKFVFFSKAVLSVLPLIDFKPDIIHCHGWQTGLVPVFYHDSFAKEEFYKNIKTVMTVHNFTAQGAYELNAVKYMTGLDDSYFVPEKLEAYGSANLLKGGIVYADYVTTVSESYAEEVRTRFFGEGLEGLVCEKSDSFKGILNGIDYDQYNSAKDTYIKYPYDISNYEENRAKNKLELQKELGLKEDKDVFLIGIVTGLVNQKGLDLIDCVFDELCSENVQVIILGSGEKRFEKIFALYSEKYPEKVSANLKYNRCMAHKMYAGCDALLRPSLFEPCGLSHLKGLRYGAIPIVRETGGFKDTVEAYDEFKHTGNGFSFRNYNAYEMLNTINYAKDIYEHDRESWNKLIENAMKKDYSWGHSALEYQRVYETITN